MFSRRDRLPRASFPTGRLAPRFSSVYFSGIFPRTGKGYAVVVSKKVLSRAVDRHRLRRRVLAALRHQRAQTLPKALILFPKAAVLRLSPEEIHADLTNLLSQ